MSVNLLCASLSEPESSSCRRGHFIKVDSDYAAYIELQWVIDNAAEVGLQHTARIRQAKIKLSQDDLTQARVLASFAPTQGFESNYSEVLADVNAREGNAEEARQFYQKAIDTLPSSQSSYAQLLSLKIDRLPAAPAVASADTTE